jgi:hypothetical protein
MSKRLGAQSPANRNDRNHGKKRDTAYDSGAREGAPESVYSPQCVIAVRREIAPCACCGQVREIVNHYCAVCRANGANEAQCMNPESIK